MANEQSIGALWVKEGKSGHKFMSGNVEINGTKYPVVVFKNTMKKEGENTPDFRIFAARQRDDTPQRQPEEEELF